MTGRGWFVTHNAILAALTAGLVLLFPTAIKAQAVNACDLTADGVVNLGDMQLATKMAQGVSPCTANVAGAGVCNIVVVQRVTHAAVSGTCLTGVPHTVSLNWTASTSSNVIGYNVYRGSVSGGPYTKLTSAPVVGTAYTDVTAKGGQTYYYVATAVDNSNNESGYSSPVTAVVPTP
jgi:hypothetical protein